MYLVLQVCTTENFYINEFEIFRQSSRKGVEGAAVMSRNYGSSAGSAPFPCLEQTSLSRSGSTYQIISEYMCKMVACNT